MKRKRKKKFFVVLISVLAGFGILSLLVYFFINPYCGTVKDYQGTLPLQETITKKEAMEDMQFMINKIKTRHYSSIHGLPQDVKKQYEAEIKNLPENPSTLEVWQASSRILSKLKDGHTGLYFINGNTSYTEAEFQVKDGITGIVINGSFYPVTKLNGSSMEDIFERAKELYSYENDIYLNYVFAGRLRLSEYLSFLGVNQGDGLAVEYEKDGRLETKTYDYKTYSETSEEIQGEENDFVSYEINKEAKTAVLTLHSCIYNEFYKDTLKKFFEEVKENTVTDIAVDLRDNGGGNSFVANEFLRYLDTKEYKDFGSDLRLGIIHIKSGNKTVNNEQYKNLLFKGSVYILTSQQTFSSATMFSVYLQDNKLGKVIGEPSGNRPSAYGDVISFELPNTRLAFNTTYKYFHRPDTSKDDMDYQIPDYSVSSEEALDKFYEIAKGN